jgi:hypothetical protein
MRNQKLIRTIATLVVIGMVLTLLASVIRLFA